MYREPEIEMKLKLKSKFEFNMKLKLFFSDYQIEKVSSYGPILFLISKHLTFLFNARECF